jgi:hypothetical protein
MATAAYVDGVDSLSRGVEWEDALELAHRKYLDRVPTDEEKKLPSNEIKNIAIANRLRALHAIHAEIIPQIRWETEDGNVYYGVRYSATKQFYQNNGERICRLPHF